jgi:hypothetical protein
MENKVNIEELKALGLSEDEIKAVMGAEDNGSGAGMPFPLAKINYDAELGKVGAIGINPIKGNEGYTEKYEYVLDGEITFRVLNSYCQYSSFNSATNKPEIVSNMFKLKDAKKARDTKTGELISELKKINDQIKFSEVALCEFNLPDGGNVIAIFYMKGAFLYNLNEQLKKLGKEKNNRTWITFKNKKQKKGAVTFFVPEVIDIQEESMADFYKEIKVVAANIKQFDDWALAISTDNNASTQSENTNTSTDEDEDEISWN